MLIMLCDFSVSIMLCKMFVTVLYNPLNNQPQDVSVKVHKQGE